MVELKLLSYEEPKHVNFAIFFGYILLGALAFFVDLSLSDMYADTNHWFGLFIERWGEVPGYIVVLYASLIKYRSTSESLKHRTFYGVITLVVSTLMSRRIIEHLTTELYWILIIGLIISSLSVSITSLWMRPPSPSQLRFADLAITMTILFPLLAVGILKLIWGRVRYRDLSSSAEFTDWFIPQGITGNQSFPSGHTAMGWMLLPLALLVGDRYRKVVLVLSSLWGIMVGWGRLVAGAHYFSDILTSSVMALVFYYNLSYYREKRAKIGQNSLTMTS